MVPVICTSFIPYIHRRTGDSWDSSWLNPYTSLHSLFRLEIRRLGMMILSVFLGISWGYSGDIMGISWGYHFGYQWEQWEPTIMMHPSQRRWDQPRGVLKQSTDASLHLRPAFLALIQLNTFYPLVICYIAIENGHL